MSSFSESHVPLSQSTCQASLPAYFSVILRQRQEVFLLDTSWPESCFWNGCLRANIYIPTFTLSKDGRRRLQHNSLHLEPLLTKTPFACQQCTLNSREKLLYSLCFRQDLHLSPRPEPVATTSLVSC
ncbi:Olfactory Receptor 1J2 [Manis pentadactyla]|nr:Olfactory Receptor 1J2 [Manis pentadactyla]